METWLSKVGESMTRYVGMGQEGERKIMPSLERACEVPKGHSGVYFPKERCLVTN